MDIDKAFEITNGVVTNPDTNTEGPFYTGGPSDPTGLDLPERTFYLQNSAGGVVIWRKFGAGVNDWRQLSAEDIPYDPSNTLGYSQTEVQAIIEALGNNPWGKDFNVEEKTASETTTGSSFTTYSVLNFTVTDTSVVNKYRVNADFLWGHNSGSNDIRIRMLFDGVQLGEELRIEPKDSGRDQRLQNNILEFPTNLTSGNHSVSLQYRPSSTSRVSRMYRSKIEVWRVE